MGGWLGAAVWRHRSTGAERSVENGLYPWRGSHGGGSHQSPGVALLGSRWADRFAGQTLRRFGVADAEHSTRPIEGLRRLEERLAVWIGRGKIGRELETELRLETRS